MSKEEIFEKLREGLLAFNDEAVKKAVEEAVSENVPPLEAIGILTDAIREAGDRFQRMEIFLPELMMAGDCMQAGMNILLKKIPKEQLQKTRLGTILIGTVRGDVHDIGKNIVIFMLTAAGFEMYDLGKDVSSAMFAEQAKKLNPDIVAMSALMTTTKPQMEEVLQYFQAVGIRSTYKFAVGGAPVTQEYADQIGADGYAPDAIAAVEMVKTLIGKRGESLS